jgi:hypothetical protein
MVKIPKGMNAKLVPQHSRMAMGLPVNGKSSGGKPSSGPKTPA